jgi:hypothetical protein
VRLPDPRLIDAYKTGFIYTQIIRSGEELKTGANGYDKNSATTSSASWPTCSPRATPLTRTGCCCGRST